VNKDSLPTYRFLTKNALTNVGQSVSVTMWLKKHICKSKRAGKNTLFLLKQFYRASNLKTLSYPYFIKAFVINYNDKILAKNNQLKFRKSLLLQKT